MKYPWDQALKVPITVEQGTFFTEDRSIWYGTFKETRNNAMRQYFFSVGEWMQQKLRVRVHPAFDVDGQVTVPPGRLVVFWPMPPVVGDHPQEYDDKIKWLSALHDANYEILKNQDIRLHSYDIKPYRLGYDFHNYGVQLEFLVPSHWPELELLPGPCNVVQLLEILGREKKHANAKARFPQV
jgi:hypothetical protein